MAGKTRRYPLKDAIEAYLAFSGLEKGNGDRWIAWKAHTLGVFARYVAGLGVRTVEALEPLHLSGYLRHCESSGDSPGTRTRRAVVIRALTRWALDQGHVTECPLARAKVRQPRPVARILPSYDEMEALAGLPHPEMAAAARLLIWTGCRRSELLRAPWAAMDLQAGIYMVPPRLTKSGKGRAVPLVPDAVALLLERKARRGLGPFLDPTGKTIFHPDSLSHAWRRHADRAARQGIRLHDLRHKFGREALDAGADIVTVQQVLGHADISTTRIYCDPNPDSAQVLRDLLTRRRQG